MSCRACSCHELLLLLCVYLEATGYQIQNTAATYVQATRHYLDHVLINGPSNGQPDLMLQIEKILTIYECPFCHKMQENQTFLPALRNGIQRKYHGQRYKESSWSVSPDGFDIVILFYARNTAAKARDTSQHPTTQVEQLSNKRHISVQEM